MFNISGEFLSKYMTSEIGRSFSEEQIKNLEEASFIHRRLFAPEVKRYFDPTPAEIQARLLQQLYPAAPPVSLSPLAEPPSVELYLPLMGLLTYAILVCILNVEHGDFKVDLLTSNVVLGFFFNLIDACVLKFALSFMNANGEFLRLNAIVGYRFVGLSVVAVVAWGGSWLLTGPALGYLMFMAFYNTNKLLEEQLAKAGGSGLVQGSICKIVCGVHIAISLLLLKLTGGL